MPAKPTKRNWNDVQTAIAMAAIATSIGMWNLFATPAKTTSAQATATVPPTDPPTDTPTSSAPTALPYVKIMFTPGATQPTVTAALQQPQQQAPQPKKKRNKGGGGGSTAPVTKTKSS